MAAFWQTRRSIPPILDDPRAATLTLAQRHTLVLLPLAVDDHGRTLDDAGRLNGLLWGNLWREHDPEAMDTDLAALAAAGYLTRYSVGDVRYLQVRDWEAEQVISRRAPSKYPAPPVEASTGAGFGHGSTWGAYGGDSGERINAKMKAAVDSFVESAQHAAERLQDPAVQTNAADYLARLAGQLDPAWGDKVRVRTNQWIKAQPSDDPAPEEPTPESPQD